MIRGPHGAPSYDAGAGSFQNARMTSASSHDWLIRFSVRLIELLPGLSGPMALRRALMLYGSWRDEDPEFSADLYVEAKAGAHRERHAPLMSA